jgi:hypothetical protein
LRHLVTRQLQKIYEGYDLPQFIPTNEKLQEFVSNLINTHKIEKSSMLDMIDEDITSTESYIQTQIETKAKMTKLMDFEESQRQLLSYIKVHQIDFGYIIM